MRLFKIGLILAVSVLYFGYFVFGPGYARWIDQLIILVCLLGFSFFREGFQKLWQNLLFIFPFVGMLLAMGVLFDWFNVMGRNDWLLDSGVKSLVFPNSFFVVSLGLGLITFRDISAFPLSDSLRQDLVVFKAVLIQGRRLMPRLKESMEDMPHFKRVSGLKRPLLLYGALVAAFFLLVLKEAEVTSSLVDNKKRFLGSKAGRK